MAKPVLTIIILLVMTATSYAQTKKVAIIVSNDITENADVNYDKAARDYIVDKLKKITTLNIAEFNEKVSGEAKEEIGTRIGGDFIDTSLTNKAKEKNIDYLVLVSYSADPFEKQMTSGGVKKITYGCRTNMYIQIIKTSNNQVLNRKHYYGSAGTAIMGSDNYKTKQEVVKASFQNSSPDFTDDTKSIDDYFKKVLNS